MIQENKVRDNDQVRGKGPGGRKGSRRPTVNTQTQQNRGDDNQHSFHCQFLPSFFLVNWFSPNTPAKVVIGSAVNYLKSPGDSDHLDQIIWTKCFSLCFLV